MKKLTIVVPVFNNLETLPNTMASLVSQTLQQSEYEILIVDDGSEDGSFQLCSELASDYPDVIRVIKNEDRKGVSGARNHGIRNALGSYLMFVDADDSLNLNAAEQVLAFFEEHSNEIDLITLKLVYLYKNGKQSTHHRYIDPLADTGIYDLSLKENRYVVQTTVNICVKTEVARKQLFDSTMELGEDQLFVSRILALKGSIGYVAEAVYYYDRTRPSSSTTKLNPLYCYEDMKFLYTSLKELGAKHPHLKDYYDALILYNYRFRIVSDSLYPYHLPKEQFDAEVSWIRSLVEDMDDSLILNYQEINLFHRYGLLAWKDTDRYNMDVGDSTLVLRRDWHVLNVETFVVAVICRFEASADEMCLQGFLRSSLLPFMDEQLTLYAEAEYSDGTSQLIEAELSASSWKAYGTKMELTCFMNFSLTVPTNCDVQAKIFARYKGYNICIRTHYRWTQPFDENKAQNTHLIGSRQYRLSGDMLSMHELDAADLKRECKRKIALSPGSRRMRRIRSLAIREYGISDRRIWLYYDCLGVARDNGLYQFMHDLHIEDGIERYYVYNGDRETYARQIDPVQHWRLVKFGSTRHKLLFVQTELIVTAFIERDNLIPFKVRTYNMMRDLLHQKTAYLQHGILHATTTWKYSYDRLRVDLVVVSTRYELENFHNKYLFPVNRLLPAGMPRYDYIDAQTKPQKRILYAPSWRRYLVEGKDESGNWIPNEKEFLQSDYYKGLVGFLSDERLAEALHTSGFELDVKLHPIFNCYQHLIPEGDSSIHKASNSVDASDYQVFMTDYSSYYFDFLYMGRTLLFFVPDYEQFRAGLSTYRELDIPFEDGFGPFASTVDQAVDNLIHVLEQGGEADEEFRRKVQGQFLHYDNHQCDRVYAGLKALADGEAPSR